jgi:hypothetical protein
LSISTVRRLEGERLHPRIDNEGVRWFDEREVAALGIQLASDPRKRVRRNAATHAVPKQSRGELAAQAFERFEQRQSLSEIVIALRVDPEVVRALFDQWRIGLIEDQLHNGRERLVPRENEIRPGSLQELASHLSALPRGQPTRISVGRFRGPYVLEGVEYADIIELGGFIAHGPCTIDDIARRYGSGDYRITASGFERREMRWEMLVHGVTARTGAK